MRTRPVMDDVPIYIYRRGKSTGRELVSKIKYTEISSLGCLPYIYIRKLKTFGTNMSLAYDRYGHYLKVNFPFSYKP